ncbi:glycosyltransferase [Methylobacillus gramineus]|uniref:CgeB family protein n=1 Tax=Methylobacillus gramineus TaxID=755169 RepID=UPI001D0007D7|nr:glycosyltransferase [Methylobacillus gramineus]MCB5184895.1 glycosyltransferase [Methylobacillus gramineus]
MGAKKKLLILDGIAGVPLGTEIVETLAELDVEATYQDCKRLSTIPLYGLRSAYSKAIQKHGETDSFFYLPRADVKQLEQLITRVKPDYILVIGFIYKFINPVLLQSIARKHNVSLFLYDTDSCNLFSKRREFIFFLETELPVYDKVFSFSRVMTDFFIETRQLKAVYHPYGAKAINIPPVSTDQKDVLFVGSADLRRIFLLESIKENVSIYGSRWERNDALMSQRLKACITDKSVWGAELHQLFADSKIVLNITRSQFYGAGTGINLRIFEALAAGTFLLTDYCDEVAELFKVGKELETFKSAAELQEKVDYYLKNPEQRLAIARQGQQAFQQRFTWRTRVQAMLEEMAA